MLAAKEAASSRWINSSELFVLRVISSWVRAAAVTSHETEEVTRRCLGLAPAGMEKERKEADSRELFQGLIVFHKKITQSKKEKNWCIWKFPQNIFSFIFWANFHIRFTREQAICFKKVW